VELGNKSLHTLENIYKRHKYKQPRWKGRP